MALHINKILETMVAKNASDLHMKSGRPPLLRIDGRIIPLENYEDMTEEDCEGIAFTLMSTKQRNKFIEANELDLAYSPAGMARFRVNIFRQRGSIEMIIRMIPKIVPTMEQLSLPAVFKKIASESRGLILLTGSVGSGKSTTIASMIQYINSEFQYHIITVEDPIEFVHSDIKSSVTQRELGIDTESYSVALKYVLRQDPDVIFIGEMRDFDTVSAAVSAAETGHLILSTLHTIDSVQTIDRLVDFYPATQQNQIRSQLSSTLVAIISMRLIEKSDGKGRVPAIEILIGTNTVKSLIRENKLSSIRGIIQQGTSQYGMQTFDQSLAELYKKGKISLEKALSEATSPSDLKLSLSGIISSAESAKEYTR